MFEVVLSNRFRKDLKLAAKLRKKTLPGRGGS